MVTRIMRYAQIVDVLGKYGFGIGLEKIFPGRARFRLPKPGFPTPVKLRCLHGLRTDAACS